MELQKLQRKYPKLREAPRNEDCVFHSGRPAVLCHRNVPGDFGTALKGPDWWGAHLCSECHAYGDGEGRKDYQWWERAIYLTQRRLFQSGRLGVL